jgi:hypothetical protein
MSPKCADPAEQGADGEIRSFLDHAGELIDRDIHQRLREDQQRIVERQLAIFTRACRRMAERVNMGATPFIDGIDFLHSAALDTGLVEVAGDDRVQQIMAAAFQGRRP